MLASVFMLFVHSAFLTLRLGSRAGSFPRPLSSAEEADALARWSAGDQEARNELIEHNLRLVAHIIKKYYTPDSDQDDLISIGTIGLIKGITTYRPDRGVRLATYASRCIENEVLMYFRSLKKTAGNVSLSESIETDGDGNALSLMDVLCDEADMVESLGAREICGNLRQTVNETLNPRERAIIEARYGLSGRPPQTQREVAAACGISRSYVSRIEKRALEKLKNTMDKE